MSENQRHTNRLKARQIAVLLENTESNTANSASNGDSSASNDDDSQSNGDSITRIAIRFSGFTPRFSGLVIKSPIIAIRFTDYALIAGLAVRGWPTTRAEGRTVMLTNVDGFDRLAIARQDGVQVADGKFIVISDNSLSSQAFTWEVKAARADVAPLEVEL